MDYTPQAEKIFRAETQSAPRNRSKITKLCVLCVSARKQKKRGVAAMRPIRVSASPREQNRGAA